MSDKYLKILNKLPKLFSSTLFESDKAFGLINEIVNFDFATIFFINQDSIQVKYSNKTFLKKEFSISSQLRKKLYEVDNFTCDKDEALIKSLKLKSENYLCAKLIIRDAVFGFILLEREKPFDNDELATMECVASILSYQIKDIELSNVFKIQLKALKDGLEETARANKIIKEQNEKILVADKVKNEFLANVSHELRTPLNAIIGFSEVLSAKLFGDLNEKQDDYIKDIHVSGLHLLGMINEILDISKIEAKAMTLNRTEFSMKLAVDEVCNVVRPLADKKSLSVIKDLKNDVQVYADYQKIQQIMYNLLSNAIKFSHDGGNIKVLVSNTPKKMVLKISDDGIGIDKKYHGKIFGKFVQLESAYIKKESSTGLGLTITKELVELHGGKISLQSEVNKGTTFIVDIPLL